MQRRKFSSEFKFKVVLLAISDKYSTEQLAEMFDLDTKQINTWKRNYLSKAEIKTRENKLFDPWIRDNMYIIHRVQFYLFVKHKKQTDECSLLSPKSRRSFRWTKITLANSETQGSFSANYYRFYRNKLLLRFLLCLLLSIFAEIASAQLTVVPDPACSAIVVVHPQVVICTTGVIASGGTAPYTYQVLGPSGPAGTSACVTGLCPEIILLL